MRHTFRQLVKSPGFTAIAVLTLALGIGLNISMFSLMNLLLLQPLPYPDKDHLVRVFRTTLQSQASDHATGDYVDLIQQSAPFADLAAYRPASFTLAQTGHPPVNVIALRISTNFFATLGMQPELGRFFTAEEDHPGSNVVILSHTAWQAQFGGDPAIIGRTVLVDDLPTTVVGVMPSAFTSVFLWGPADGFRPLALTNAEKIDRTNDSLRVFGRIHRDISLVQVNARLVAIAEQIAHSRPRQHRQDGLRAVTLQSTASNVTNTQITWLLLSLAGFVLLIACANLANLQLARALTRAHEFAIRTALGASRARLLLPLLGESLLLSLAGGLLGILVAVWSNDWITSRLAANGATTLRLTLDWRVLSFALVLSALTGVIFGLVPAWVVSRVRVGATLKSGTRGNTGDRTQHRFRHALIVAQFALALVLLAGAGIFIRGLDSMLTRESGWDHRSTLQGLISLPSSHYSTPGQTYAFYTELQERLGALPGVEHVAVGWALPVFQFSTSRNYVVEGRELPPVGREPLAFVNGVTPSYLATLKIALVSGRNFSAADTHSSRPVVIINESMARALFPNQNPLGHRLGGLEPAQRDWAEIVGIIPDLQMAVSLLPPTTTFQVLRPLSQETWNYVTIVLRAHAADTLAEPMRNVIAQMDPTLPVQHLSTVDEAIKLGTGGLAMVNTILVVFALLGLFLAALGLYGVIARLVVQRTPEIGVRVALGAQSGDVVWLILRTGLQLTTYGTVVGLLGAAGLAKLIGLILPSLPVQDPLVIAAVTVLLLLVALFACWLPARRATKVDPLTALRAE